MCGATCLNYVMLKSPQLLYDSVKFEYAVTSLLGEGVAMYATELMLGVVGGTTDVNLSTREASETLLGVTLKIS